MTRADKSKRGATRRREEDAVRARAVAAYLAALGDPPHGTAASRRALAAAVIALTGERAACSVLTIVRRAGVYVPRRGPCKAWRTSETEALREVVRERGTLKDAVRRLRRSGPSVLQKAGEMGLRFRRLERVWTPGERRVVDDTLEPVIAHLAVRLNRSETAIASAVARSVMRFSKRARGRAILDLGGGALVPPKSPPKRRKVA